MKNSFFNNNAINLFLFSLLATAITFSSCKKDDDDGHSDDQELITTLLLHFENNGTATTFAWRDVDGIGGNAPEIDNIDLAANTTYTLTLEVLDESKDPVDDITEEIRDEDEEHIFLFEDSGSLLTITTIDVDDEGNPVGLENNAVTGASGTGNLTISLKHEADKSNPANTGETDIEVTMPYIVN